MTTFSEAHANVAKELATATIQALASGGSMHPGTVVAATARMAGTYLFRSFNLSLPGLQPGVAVLSEAANEKVPVLIRIAAAIVASLGVTLDNTKAAEPTEQRHQPRLAFLETQRMLEPIYRAITDRSGMSDYDGARAAAVAAGMLVPQCAKVMEPNTGFRIASFGIVEGAKTAPDPVTLRHGAA
jgi:hypothetical protein